MFGDERMRDTQILFKIAPLPLYPILPMLTYDPTAGIKLPINMIEVIYLNPKEETV